MPGATGHTAIAAVAVWRHGPPALPQPVGRSGIPARNFDGSPCASADGGITAARQPMPRLRQGVAKAGAVRPSLMALRLAWPTAGCPRRPGPPYC